MYSLIEPELGQARADGLTAIGPYYGKSNLRKTIERAQIAKLPVLYTIGPRLDFEINQKQEYTRALTLLASEVAEASQHTEIGAWVLANEELRYWRKTEMDWLRNATQTIRANDPHNRPILMYEPNNRSAHALVKTSQYLDFIAKGTYANYVGMKHTRTWIRHSIEQAVSAANSTNTIPLAILWMARDQDNDEDIADIQKWARHDVYLSLITGAKGIIIFSGWSKRPGFEKHYHDFYEGYTSAAKELSGELQLGRVFLYGKKQSGINISVIEGPETQQFKYRDQTYEYTTISFKYLLLDDKHYLFIINSANEEVSISIDGLPASLQLYNVFTEEQIHSTIAKLDKLNILAISWEAKLR